VQLSLDLDGLQLVVSLSGRHVELIVQPDPKVVHAVRFLSSATSFQFLVFLLALLISAHLGLSKFLNDAFDRDLLGLSAHKSLLD
jgi:hypothetical protein